MIWSAASGSTATRRWAACFTAKHNISRLVWFEWFTRIDDAIAAEKRIKGWGRAKKLALIEAENPKWWDLSRDWEI